MKDEIIIKNKRGKVLPYYPWNFDAEPGDIMVTMTGDVYRLYERSFSPSSAAGELCTRRLKKKGYKAYILNDETLVWRKEIRK